MEAREDQPLGLLVIYSYQEPRLLQLIEQQPPTQERNTRSADMDEDSAMAAKHAREDFQSPETEIAELEGRIKIMAELFSECHDIAVQSGLQVTQPALFVHLRGMAQPFSS